MTPIYYKNDFTARIMLRDRQGRAVAVPPVDFSARLSTPGSPRHVTISQKAGERRGFTVDTDGAIVVPMDNHGLWPGPLRVDFEFELPDSSYPDGAQHIERHYHLDIDLTMNPDDLPCDAEATIPVPWVPVYHDPVVGTLELITDAAVYSVSICGALPSCGPLPEPTPEPDGYYYYYATSSYDIGSWDLLSDIEPASIDIEL